MNHASTTSHHIADAVFVCVFRAVFERVFRDAEISGSDFKISGSDFEISGSDFEISGLLFFCSYVCITR